MIRMSNSELFVEGSILMEEGFGMRPNAFGPWPRSAVQEQGLQYKHGLCHLEIAEDWKAASEALGEAVAGPLRRSTILSTSVRVRLHSRPCSIWRKPNAVSGNSARPERTFPNSIERQVANTIIRSLPNACCRPGFAEAQLANPTAHRDRSAECQCVFRRVSTHVDGGWKDLVLFVESIAFEWFQPREARSEHVGALRRCVPVEALA